MKKFSNRLIFVIHVTLHVYFPRTHTHFCDRSISTDFKLFPFQEVNYFGKWTFLFNHEGDRCMCQDHYTTVKYWKWQLTSRVNHVCFKEQNGLSVRHLSLNVYCVQLIVAHEGDGKLIAVMIQRCNFAERRACSYQAGAGYVGLIWLWSYSFNDWCKRCVVKVMMHVSR